MQFLEKYRTYKREYIFALIIILFTNIISFVPYINGALNTPKGCYFIGYPYPLDTNKYFGQMLQGARKGILYYQNHLTTEPHQPAILFNFYLVLGKIAQIFHLNFIMMFHIARVLLGTALLIYIYSKSHFFFKESYHRLGVLVLLCFSSGFSSPSEADTFKAITLFPHFVTAMLLMVVYFYNFCYFSSYRSTRTSLYLCAVMIFLTGIIHPWNILTMFFISLLFFIAFIIRKQLLLSKELLLGYLVLLIVAIAILGLHLNTLRTNPVFKAVAEQNISSIKSIGEVINYFGVLWIPTIIGAILALRRYKSSLMLFPALWLIGSLFLISLPFSFQRRVVEGLHIPIVFSTAFCLFIISEKLSVKLLLSKKSTAIVIIILTLMASTFHNLYSLRFPSDHPDFVYYPPIEMVKNMEWIDENVPENSNIMASIATGQLLCRYTLTNSFVVHSVETVDFNEKNNLMMWFYSGTAGIDQMKELLKFYNIQYVIYGSWEYCSPNLNLLKIPWLGVCYRNKDFFIFKVRQ